VDAIFHNKYPANGFGSLVVTAQPFPDVVKQKEKKRTKGHQGHHEAHLEVQILTGARSSVVVVSKVSVDQNKETNTVLVVFNERQQKKDVTAELMWDNDKDQKAKGSSSILNPSAPLKKQGGVARFDELRFSKVWKKKKEKKRVVISRFLCSGNGCEDCESSVFLHGQGSGVSGNSRRRR
jgi:hypothetical protein